MTHPHDNNLIPCEAAVCAACRVPPKQEFATVEGVPQRSSASQWSSPAAATLPLSVVAAVLLSFASAGVWPHATVFVALISSLLRLYWESKQART